MLNEPSRRPISHIAWCPEISEERKANTIQEPRYIATNSYDNIIRIYDRGLDVSTRTSTPMKVLHKLKGHKNKHWPIKSSFYAGPSRQTHRTREWRVGSYDDLGFNLAEAPQTDPIPVAAE